MIDLHAHTTISDGTYTPTKLVKEAKRRGLYAVAITDHDSIDGLDEASEAARRLGITLVKGIEFSIAYGKGRLLHILGLGIDPDSEGFKHIYLKYRETRSTKLEHVFEALRGMGIDISHKKAIPHIIGGFMDRQAIARCLVAEGYAISIRNSWTEYLDKIPYIEGELIEPEAALDAIHAAGGKAFMAHFHLNIGLKDYSDKEIRSRLKELKDMGLDGVEYYYPSFSDEDRLRLADYIHEFGFIKSGGSDFHGANRPHIKLGIGEGNFRVPDELLKNILPDKKETASA